MKAAAIIVAAGAGRRFGSPVPKQFLKLEGKPVFSWSIEAFRGVRDICQIILVVPPDMPGSLKSVPRKYGCVLVPGGSERYDSVRAGLTCLDPAVEYVAIHDAARPLITPELIRKALNAARDKGASVVAVAARDTIKESRRGTFVSRTIPRSTVWLAQTPQTFRRDIITAAYKRRFPAGITDDAQAVEHAGRKVAVVPGSYHNIKITEPADMAVARLWLRERK